MTTLLPTVSDALQGCTDVQRVAPVTELARLAADIASEHRAVEQHSRDAVAHAIRCGELLTRAKAQVSHGEWAGWLEANFRASARTASAYMRLHANRQRVADLTSVRQALEHLVDCDHDGEIQVDDDPATGEDEQAQQVGKMTVGAASKQLPRTSTPRDPTPTRSESQERRLREKIRKRARMGDHERAIAPSAGVGVDEVRRIAKDSRIAVGRSDVLDTTQEIGRLAESLRAGLKFETIAKIEGGAQAVNYSIVALDAASKTLTKLRSELRKLVAAAAIDEVAR